MYPQIQDIVSPKFWVLAHFAPPCVLSLLVLSFYFSLELLCGPDGELPEKLRNLEPHLIEHISNEIMDKDPNVRWDDIGNYNN